MNIIHSARFENNNISSSITALFDADNPGFDTETYLFVIPARRILTECSFVYVDLNDDHPQ
jgi:hypothetical protein